MHEEIAGGSRLVMNALSTLAYLLSECQVIWLCETKDCGVDLEKFVRVERRLRPSLEDQESLDSRPLANCVD